MGETRPLLGTLPWAHHASQEYSHVPCEGGPSLCHAPLTGRRSPLGERLRGSPCGRGASPLLAYAKIPLPGEAEGGRPGDGLKMATSGRTEVSTAKPRHILVRGTH